MKKKEMNKKYDPSNLFRRNHKYNERYRKDEEKSRSRSEKLPVLSAPKKPRINSYKFENETRKILYFLYQHNKITKNVWNSLIKLL